MAHLLLHDRPVNDGGRAWIRGWNDGLNPRFWDDIDRRVAYVNSRGLVVSFAFAGIGRGYVNPFISVKS